MDSVGITLDVQNARNFQSDFVPWVARTCDRILLADESHGPFSLVTAEYEDV